MCLSLLSHFKGKLLLQDDISGILYHIKFKNTPEKQITIKPTLSDNKTTPFVMDETTGQLIKSTNHSGSENVATSSNSSGELYQGEKKLFLSRIFDFITRKSPSEE